MIVFEIAWGGHEDMEWSLCGFDNPTFEQLRLDLLTAGVVSADDHSDGLRLVDLEPSLDRIVEESRVRRALSVLHHLPRCTTLDERIEDGFRQFLSLAALHGGYTLVRGGA